MAIAGYVLPIGWLVAFFASDFCKLRNNFVVFHLRQALGVNIMLCLFWGLFKIVNIWLLQQFVGVVCVLSAAYGILAANEGNKRKQPLLGTLFNNLFTFIR